MMRCATLEEVRLLADWAAAEGWNPGLEDAEAFLAADPGGFFVAVEGAEVIAGISVVNHDANFAFLGFYLCRPDRRGQGHGFALWKHALEHAAGRTVGLDGVADQQENYARSGFILAGASQRHEGRMDPATGQDSAIRPFDPADLDTLIALDQDAGGAGRAAFLTAWLEPRETRRTVVRSGLDGYATIRRCREGVKLGPVIAPDADAALALIRAALAELPSDKVIIDLPSWNRPLRAALQEMGFVVTFETARMYRGPAPAMQRSLQAIGTMELG
ncbi:GNAT family N-acetyltransferase [Pseudooceanicola sp. HF7]|uniref:GNAT family N-acetyltransferase n=1 Tax=Pseudooceanicola sp. HF7 TaxID=2721560 RepID=UPI001431A4E8|nr:GNAT family N-acetyltransferase [Pseudooceanicola sp. HF7]NIZ08481.1 GNAT family N-acetyltransferase [Pseudooceanicola sp. HF7]